MLEVYGADETAAALTLAGTRLALGVPLAVASAARMIERDQKATVRRRTGRTHDSISADKVGPAEWLVGSDWYVGRLLETGTARHPPFPWAFQTADACAGRLAADVARLLG